MQKLKSIISKVISNDALDICKRNDPTPDDYSIVIHNYQMLSSQKKKASAENIQKKLTKPHSNRQTLQLLILCDFLSGTHSQILGQFPAELLKVYQDRTKIKCTTRQQKRMLGESSFIYFYTQYLKQKLWEQRYVDNITASSLQDGLAYCESAIEALKLVIQHDFIIEYALANCELKNQVKIAVENVLRRSSEDLTILIKFVDKWNYLIIEQGPQAVSVNFIYEQVIFISKNISRFEGLSGRVKISLKFPRYELNKNLNQTIQKTMLSKEGEKKSFMSHRRLKTSEDFNQCTPEVTQSQIFMNVKL